MTQDTENPPNWPPRDIVGLVRQLISCDYQHGAQSLPDYLREIASYIDPIGARRIKGLADMNAEGFLVDRACQLLDILLAIDPSATKEEENDGVSALVSAVARRDVVLIEGLLNLMRETQEIHPITLALAVKRELEKKHKRLPAKGEIKAQMLKLNCGLKEDCNQSWRRLWEAAGLDYLPKMKARRGKTAHGARR